MKKLVITNVKTIITAPEGINLLVVKVLTNDPSIYGVGCATFTQRIKVVKKAIDSYLRPMLIGKSPNNIEDIWQACTANSYWRNGPVLNNAVAGIDMALWDIKGKLADMPLYELFGGKCRDAIPAYTHVDASSVDDAVKQVQGKVDQGWINIRVQINGYGGSDYGPVTGPNDGVYYDPYLYMDTVLRAFTKVHDVFGDKIRLIHDVHERLTPNQAITFLRKMEKFSPLFMEDVVPLEQMDWLGRVRDQTSVPLSMGELFNNPREWMKVIQDRDIDFIRCHISQIGGITPIRKLIAFADLYGIQTSWHGPGDLSAIGHAVNAQLSLSSHNCGVQEWSNSIKENTYRVFPGTPTVRDGYIYVNDHPGIGVDIDEEAAKEYPEISFKDDWTSDWTISRLPDGTCVRP
ncbi:enolase C-terminal domain-like protein [Lactobacillus sp. ESL0679]|uniref:enolase C-terminal domain-like protein n=1 Tax=Lactobacillus sp. ESL0679 TaxID=2983209 RepID=UPI0023F92E43|nr:enolase C-terminal domain-like protein [Lactobacillus sp. ESL0679]MDF7682417.1 enolase C-terminal domain-like protein [Lactobacillus sp. ESL0679]